MLYRLSSWNVNGIRAIQKKGFLEYLKSAEQDIIGLQETKAHPEQLDSALLSPDGGFAAHYHSCSIKKGYSGVALFTKIAPKRIWTTIGEERFDQEGRMIWADFDDFVLVNAYFPNGSDEEKGRLQYKLDFYDALFAHAQKLRQEGRKIVVCGDFNTSHQERDLARPKENVKTSGFLPQERAVLDALLADGYVDTFREFTQEGGHYSWWSNRMGARERNIGWRLDYFYITEDLRPNLQQASIHADIGGSDHCPVSIVLKF